MDKSECYTCARGRRCLEHPPTDPRITGQYTAEESGDDIWIMDGHGFCIANMRLRHRGAIAEFTPDEVRAQAEWIVAAMNAQEGGPN